jgi:hypothetical protein
MLTPRCWQQDLYTCAWVAIAGKHESRTRPSSLQVVAALVTVQVLGETAHEPAGRLALIAESGDPSGYLHAFLSLVATFDAVNVPVATNHRTTQPTHNILYSRVAALLYRVHFLLVTQSLRCAASTRSNLA